MVRSSSLLVWSQSCLQVRVFVENDIFYEGRDGRYNVTDGNAEIGQEAAEAVFYIFALLSEI